MKTDRTIAIVTPTFNSMRTLDQYMNAVLSQNYPHELLEFMFADGGSTDGTLERLREYQEKIDIRLTILHNPLRTAEAGKAVGVRAAKTDLVLLLDSDNILPSDDWLTTMVEPFTEECIVASEPIAYTYRRTDTVINRYCALIGMNDPLCLFTGNYDRYCHITGKWTQVEHEEIDCGSYLSVAFQKVIPTIGANGFMMRTDALRDNFSGDYLFDIDVLWVLFQKDPSLRVAKVKTGIVHLFCENLGTFFRKQNRRIRDYLYFNDTNARVYPWSSFSKLKIMKFILYCMTILPLLIQALMGYSKKRDIRAWLFHIVACLTTLITYGLGTIFSIFGKKQVANREHWKQ